ncbi:MAG: helix-turn-helix domain-containing protein, partial [Oceanobacter sp.]
MDRFKAMQTFVAIVDQGSLSAAAEQLDRSPAAVVRTLAALEQALGV